MKRNAVFLCLLTLFSLAPTLRAELLTAAPSACAADSALSAALGQIVPENVAVCPNIRCGSSAECAQACPTAISATCGATTHACTYTFSGGGGGGGGCPNIRCSGDSECVCRGRQGTCGTQTHACTY
jgi:hypothetical protein